MLNGIAHTCSFDAVNILHVKLEKKEYSQCHFCAAVSRAIRTAVSLALNSHVGLAGSQYVARTPATRHPAPTKLTRLVLGRLERCCMPIRCWSARWWNCKELSKASWVPPATSERFEQPSWQVLLNKCTLSLDAVDSTMRGDS